MIPLQLELESMIRGHDKMEVLFVLSEVMMGVVCWPEASGDRTESIKCVQALFDKKLEAELAVRN